MSYLYIDYLKDIYTKGGSKKVQDFCFFINYYVNLSSLLLQEYTNITENYTKGISCKQCY